jgi:K+ transporter
MQLDPRNGISIAFAVVRAQVRNSSDASDYFRLPRDMVVEIGRQFAI